jgi:hypothetical protein
MFPPAVPATMEKPRRGTWSARVENRGRRGWWWRLVVDGRRHRHFYLSDVRRVGAYRRILAAVVHASAIMVRCSRLPMHWRADGACGERGRVRRRHRLRRLGEICYRSRSDRCIGGHCGADCQTDSRQRHCRAIGEMLHALASQWMFNRRCREGTLPGTFLTTDYDAINCRVRHSVPA